MSEARGRAVLFLLLKEAMSGDALGCSFACVLLSVSHLCLRPSGQPRSRSRALLFSCALTHGDTRPMVPPPAP